ncbi:MAG: hypothetical protein PHC34_14150 [Candidatus Gastranaerophilales bacterium]|nr:hypothetical protein [Candidatus Gastranaerophilales bacterium]
MNNCAVKPVSRPVKVNVVRMEDIFQNSNPYESFLQPIIKDYIYIESRVIIA